MHLSQTLITSGRVVAFTVAAVVLYIFWQGPERFYYESLGTWSISPLIYASVLPFPVNEWLIVGMRHIPLLTAALHTAPLLMLAISFALAMYSIWNSSVLHALISLGLVATVFSVYHVMQPFGITLIRY